MNFISDIRVSKEQIVNLNKHILDVSGASTDIFGMPNEGNLDYAIDKANYQQDPIDQATTLMHEIVRGQPFTNANKRTGFETASGALVAGGYIITAKPEKIIPFVESINKSGLSAIEVKEWLTTHSEFTGNKSGFVEASGANVIRDVEMLKKMD